MNPEPGSAYVQPMVVLGYPRWGSLFFIFALVLGLPAWAVEEPLGWEPENSLESSPCGWMLSRIAEGHAHPFLVRLGVEGAVPVHDVLGEQELLTIAASTDLRVKSILGISYLDRAQISELRWKDLEGFDARSFLERSVADDPLTFNRLRVATRNAIYGDYADSERTAFPALQFSAFHRRLEEVRYDQEMSSLHAGFFFRGESRERLFFIGKMPEELSRFAAKSSLQTILAGADPVLVMVGEEWPLRSPAIRERADLIRVRLIRQFNPISSEVSINTDVIEYSGVVFQADGSLNSSDVLSLTHAIESALGFAGREEVVLSVSLDRLYVWERFSRMGSGQPTTPRPIKDATLRAELEEYSMSHRGLPLESVQKHIRAALYDVALAFLKYLPTESPQVLVPPSGDRLDFSFLFSRDDRRRIRVRFY